MGWSLILWVGGAIVGFFLVEMVYLGFALTWGEQNTRGLAYYGLSPAERHRFKRRLRRQARLLAPVIRFLGLVSGDTFSKSTFRHRGLAGPQGTCSEESFARADDYRPQPEDVFVVTQMKCGTTWMQHVVYQILHRGRGDLVETGATLYSVCPWLEGLKSVSVEEAPLVGTECPSRVIKTHLPVSRCPQSPDARYIYVVRHPVSCFASCSDFIATNAGVFAPAPDVLEAWFCSSENMWWGPWPDHVAGWWDRAQEHHNVLFVHFEDMKNDLAGIANSLARFLGVTPLTTDELSEVLKKCSFAYMQEHKDTFEMHPPHLLAANAELFVSGRAERHKDVPEDTRARIAAWCAVTLADRGYPLGSHYPDVAAAGR